MTKRGKVLWSLNREWYWPSEVAVILGINHATVYRRIESGDIMTILKGRPFKVMREEVERILSQE